MKTFRARPVMKTFRARPVMKTFRARPVMKIFRARPVMKIFRARPVMETFRARPVIWLLNTSMYWYGFVFVDGKQSKSAASLIEHGSSLNINITDSREKITIVKLEVSSAFNIIALTNKCLFGTGLKCVLGELFAM